MNDFDNLLKYYYFKINYESLVKAWKKVKSKGKEELKKDLDKQRPFLVNERKSYLKHLNEDENTLELNTSLFSLIAMEAERSAMEFCCSNLDKEEREKLFVEEKKKANSIAKESFKNLPKSVLKVELGKVQQDCIQVLNNMGLENNRDDFYIDARFKKEDVVFEDKKIRYIDSNKKSSLCPIYAYGNCFRGGLLYGAGMPLEFEQTEFSAERLNAMKSGDKKQIGGWDGVNVTLDYDAVYVMNTIYGVPFVCEILMHNVCQNIQADSKGVELKYPKWSEEDSQAE